MGLSLTLSSSSSSPSLLRFPSVARAGKHYWLHQIRICSDLCSHIPTPISQEIPIPIYRAFASPLPSLSFSHRTKDSKGPDDFLTLPLKGSRQKRADGADPPLPPLTVSLTVKYRVFFDDSPFPLKGTHKILLSCL